MKPSPTSVGVAVRSSDGRGVAVGEFSPVGVTVRVVAVGDGLPARSIGVGVIVRVMNGTGVGVLGGALVLVLIRATVMVDVPIPAIE